MNELITPLFTILGVILGGGLSYFTAVRMKRLEAKQESIKAQIEIRRQLYAKFLSEANDLAIKTIEKSNPRPFLASEISKHLAEIELISNESIFKKAKEIANYLLEMDSQTSDQKTKFLPELRTEFITLAREEFKEIEMQHNTYELSRSQ